MSAGDDNETEDDGSGDGDNPFVENFPDLVIETLTAEPANPEPGEMVTSRAVVKNQGNEESEDTTLAYYIEGVWAGTKNIPELEPGSSALVSFEWTAGTEGTVEIRVQADPWNYVVESNEWNNEKTARIEVKKETYPDLIVEKISCNPREPETGKKATVTVDVKNQGRDKSEPTNLAFYINGVHAGEASVPELSPDSSSSVSFEWVPESQDIFELRAIVDSDNKVFESNEENNEKIERVTSKKEAYPDLVITELSAEPGKAEPGETVTIAVTIRNKGDERSGPTNLVFYINEEYLGELHVPELAAKSSHSMSYQWVPETEGIKWIRARVDEDKLVFESNELNNGESDYIAVEKQRFPDLVIEELVADPAQPELGEEVTIKVAVENQGTDRSEDTGLEYYINGAWAGEREIPELGPGESSEVSLSWTPESEGTEWIRAVADAEDEVLESNERNNVKILSIEVTKQKFPDLVIETLSAEPVNPRPGEKVTINAVIKNQGTEKSEGTGLECYIDEVRIEEKKLPGLNPGESSTFSFEWVPEERGTSNVLIIADPSNHIQESNEGNNEESLSIEVTRQKFPDLAIEGLTATPEKPVTGNNVTFMVIVKNQGNSISEENVLEYEIEGTNKGSLSIPELSAGETSTKAFSWVAGNKGEVEVTATVDAGNEVLESNEENNEIVKTVNVSGEKTVDSGEESGDSPGSSGSSGSSNSGSSTSSSSSSGSSGSRSSGSGGSGGSKEPAGNIEIKELSTRYIIYGYHVSYHFPENVTCVTLIEFDPRRTFKKTTTIVEVLKDKSAFVSTLPPGKIYKNLNIWVGDKGAGNPESLENACIEFRVEKSWIEKNQINESLINLLRYDKGWNPLDPEKTGEDGQYVYFKATTPGFSPFAISEYTGQERTTEETTNRKPGEEIKGVPSSLGEFIEEGEVKGSAEIDEKSKGKKPIMKTKVLIAVSLPIFLILIEFLIMKKKD